MNRKNNSANLPQISPGLKLLLAKSNLGYFANELVKLENGNKFSFENHEYLQELYLEHHPYTVVQKGTQMAITTWAFIKSIWLCLNVLTLGVVYYFPTQKDVWDFSRGRITPFLNYNQAIKMHDDEDINNVGMKHIGKAYLYFRGMQTSISAKSVPADGLIFDEIDEAPPQAMDMALKRIDHSRYPFVHELSNPTIEGYGINRSFNQSDQRYWHIKCLACNTWNSLDKQFPHCLQETKESDDHGNKIVIRICKKCKRELPISNPGEWIADRPSVKEKRGYLVSQLYSAYVSPTKIMQEYKSKKGYELETFMRLRLGRAFVLGENRVTKQKIYSLVSKEEIENNKDVSGFMGVDVGKDLHVTIIKKLAGKEVLLRVFKADSFEELDKVMDDYQILCGVVDALPELREARRFKDKHLGKIFLCYYNDAQKGDYKWNLKEGQVDVNRTESLDASQHDFMHGGIVINANQPDLVEFAVHCENEVRQTVEGAKGKKRIAWVETGPDHYRHSYNYSKIAASRIRHELRIL